MEYLQSLTEPLLQPDYEGELGMDESKFRQELEKRNKRADKKHGRNGIKSSVFRREATSTDYFIRQFDR